MVSYSWLSNSRYNDQMSCNWVISPEQIQNTDAPKISKYAYGKDYHEVIKEKLKEFLNTLKEQIGDVNGRAFVDSAPVLDKAWAKKSGLGWIGKNGNLLTQKVPLFDFHGELRTKFVW